MIKCRNCLIPQSVPGVTIAGDGRCNFCSDDRAASQRAATESARQVREVDLERALCDCRGQGDYDCVVPLSGGKDSIYLLHRLKRDYGLRVLAFTVDINLPPLAWQSIRQALGKLDIDHVVYRPSAEFYERIFRYALRNQEARGAVYTVSYIYAPLFEGDAIRLAVEKRIPLVLAGYSPGQPEPERMHYEFSRRLICEADWAPPALRQCGEFSDEDLKRFHHPAHYPAGTVFPRYLAPFHAWQYDQEEIMRKVVDLGLVATKKHANPIHSNYPINWLLMYSDIRTFGYNPYVPEFAALIRAGKASRRYWRMMGPIVDFMITKRFGPGLEVTRSLQWLGLRAEELRVTLPRGAYDPVLPAAGSTIERTPTRA